jgi:hypothetical protein
MNLLRIVKNAPREISEIPDVPLAESVLRLRGAVRNLKQAIDVQNTLQVITEHARLLTEIKIFEKAASISIKNSATSRLLLNAGRHEMEASETILQTVW